MKNEKRWIANISVSRLTSFPLFPIIPPIRYFDFFFFIFFFFVDGGIYIEFSNWIGFFFFFFRYPYIYIYRVILNIITGIHVIFYNLHDILIALFFFFFFVFCNFY